MDYLCMFLIVLVPAVILFGATKLAESELKDFLNEVLVTSHFDIDKKLDNKGLAVKDLHFLLIERMHLFSSKYAECKVMLRTSSNEFYLVRYVYRNEDDIRKIHFEGIGLLTNEKAKKILLEHPELYEKHISNDDACNAI